jgi:hypothetical protein
MRSFLLSCAALMLSSCVPAEYIHLYNASGEEIIITKTKSKEVVTIAPNASADFTPFYLAGERLVIRTPKHSWQYSFAQFRMPPSFYEQHLMVMRAFARIDSRGQLYLLIPPHDGGSPQETAQPPGFPVKPQKT